MKKSVVAHTSILFVVFFIVFLIARSPPRTHLSFHEEGVDIRVDRKLMYQKKEILAGGGEEEEGKEYLFGTGTGSSLPDCTHACGPCYPCKRVMVSFKCSIAESCPTVYRCLCKGKYYHVPSN